MVQLRPRIFEMTSRLKSWCRLSAYPSSRVASARMARASWAGPEPAYPHSNPSGRWFSSSCLALSWSVTVSPSRLLKLTVTSARQ